MIKVFIQVESGSAKKQLHNEQTLEFKGIRDVPLPYPYPYGFILDTLTNDGDGLDCYILTSEKLRAGDIVECEPVGMLEQFEDGQADHKILASMPGQRIDPGPEVLHELSDFIKAIFGKFPGIRVEVGGILSAEKAIEQIRESRDKSS